MFLPGGVSHTPAVALPWRAMTTHQPVHALHHQPTARGRLATLMAFESLTLAVAAVLHLTGADSSRSGGGAGTAEALIFLALAFGAAALARRVAWGRSAALIATGFAIFGFVAGLTFTVQGGGAADVAYHVTMLPILIATLVGLTRMQGPGS
jgi:hypothetical protein